MRYNLLHRGHNGGTDTKIHRTSHASPGAIADPGACNVNVNGGAHAASNCGDTGPNHGCNTINAAIQWTCGCATTVSCWDRAT